MNKIFMQISTLWDREWYLPFQSFRYNLVKTTDKIIDELEDGKHIDTFVFDGQSIVVEDYLEAIPEKKEMVSRLVKNGKMKLGPWYVMPDELLVSGESIIKNFLVGKAVCNKFGTEPFLYGYANDIFGHIAQFPQILNKLGINMTYIGRGLSDFECRHFKWSAPDGSECFGYKNNYSLFYREYIEYIQDKPRSLEEKTEYVKKNIDSEFDKSELDVILVNVTDDHGYLNDNMLELIDIIKNLDGYEVYDSGFYGALEYIKPFADSIPRISGELIKTSESADKDLRVVTDSISSYYPLKKENDTCQHILEDKLSPMLVYNKLNGGEMKKEFLALAYKELLKNHPHDSICGCSADQVHKDMEYRYDQVKAIADIMQRDFTISIKPERDDASENYILTVFNPAPYEREGIIAVDLDFGKDFKTKFAGNASNQPVCMFKILDSKGNDMPYQIINIDQNLEKMKELCSQKMEAVDRYTVLVNAKLNAFEKTEFRVVPTEKIIREKNVMPHGDCWAENDYVRLDIEQDGTISIYDKTADKHYNNMCYFLDESDAGNGWFYESAANQNPSVSSRFSDCTLELVRAGKLAVTFRITKRMNVPKSMVYESYNRSDEREILEIISEITLKSDSGKIYVETKVKNNVKDHRLKLLIPTGIGSETYTSSQAFYIAERKTGLAEDALDRWEPEPLEKHFNGIICNRDEDGDGIAFVGDAGFHQAGVDSDGTISVILLRSFGRMYMQNNPERCQLQGEHTFKYVLTPINETVKMDSIMNGRRFNFEKEITCFERGEGISSELVNKLSVTGDNVVVSVIKPAESDDDMYIVRVFNISDAPTELCIDIDRVCDFCETNMYEKEIKQIAESCTNIKVQLVGNEIKTVGIRSI